MPSYDYLNKLPPWEFLNTLKFGTEADGFAENIKNGLAKKQYQKGLELKEKAEHIFICANGTWGAKMKDGGTMTSCEGIGYHACTMHLLGGFIDSGLPIWIYRQNGNDMIINEKREVVPMDVNNG